MTEKKKYNKQSFLYPDSGPFPRSMYPKHMAFMKAGATFKERALIAANRTGKTYLATSELSFHANGRYPDWWEGKKFNHPTKIWCVGQTHETTKDILQEYLCGTRYDLGTGMIPKQDIERTTSKSGIQDAIQDVYVKWYDSDGVQRGVSQITFKSYIQGVEAFMGTSIDVVALDEEPDPNIYSECLTRTMTTKGIVLCTFTPLHGLSETVLSFLPGGRFPEDGIVGQEE